jgi:hypothetical protein
MITETTHPGACTVSEAVLCAGDKAPEVIAWAFEVQDRIREEAKADPTAAAREVKQRFPELAACVGSPEAKARLNKSLRWAVSNNIRVLTPQLFVDNVKLCDEDVDLGLEYALTNMLDRHAHGTLAKSATAAPPAPPALSPEPPPAAPAKPAERDHDTDKPKPRPPEEPAAPKEPPAPSPEKEKAEPAAPAPAQDKPVTSPQDKPVTSPDQVGSQGGAP